MRIEFITDDNPLYILPFFEEFLRHYAADFDITRISSCRPMGKRSRADLLKQLAYLYGPTGIVLLTTRWVTARMLGLLPRRRSAYRFHTLKQLCRAYSIPFVRIGNPNDPGLVSDTKARRPDLLVSIACPYILKEPLLSTPKFGCINMHHAPLPRYKGMMPTFWQLYQGEKKVGVTIHYMNAKLDEGAALFQGELDVQPGESLDHLIQRSKRHGAHCMARVVHDIAGQTQRTITLDSSSGSYFTFPTIDQIREFRRRGLRAL
ncbi:MAG TPA: formyltransferase family protein [Anaerolineales bacterium]|nr:formyltransferase family protein [Anaerolineales bacterium]